MKLQARGSDQHLTTLKTRFAELEKRMHLLQHALDGLPQSIRIVDRDLNVVYANRAASGPGADPASGANVKCYHCAGRIEPCEDCPANQGTLSAEHPYALLALMSPESRPDASAQACALLSRLPGSAPFEGADEPAEAEAGRLGDLLGRSEPMQRLFEMIRLVAPTDATVLLEGESGTGKEMVARTMHGLSRRRAHRFVVIDCGALPETLLESELFGHVRGAFTGAVAGKSGLFEEAEGGTIFLDEIADMSPALQAKLLRVIQEGEIKPVGVNRRIKVNVRVIAASNKALAPLVAAKAFREDLFYRLAVIPMTIPPLRHRREDIPLLVEAFMAESCARYGRDVLAVPDEALRLLTNHAWPGNARELRHVIERAVLTGTGPELAADRLFADLVGMPPPAMPVVSLRDERQGAVRLFERARIAEALRQSKGNKARAARSLKISRASFYNKIREYQIIHSGAPQTCVSSGHTERISV
jgi:two-component system response regulator AtoC